MTVETRIQEPINWQAVYDEALDIFVRYLRIPSVNPPGNEAPAARFLGSLIEAAGVSCEYIETEPNREAVVARLKGDGSKGALMLGNHLDVVPVEADFWDMPPFEGLIKFIPVLLSAEEAAGFHGNNEKLSIDNLNLGCELTYEVVRRFCS